MAERGASRTQRPRVVDPAPSAKGLRVAIVVSSYNGAVTDRLREGATAEFLRLGGRGGDLTIVPAPGSFELPALALGAARGRDGVVTLGCIIRGETIHDRVIADAVAQGVMDVGLRTGVPVAFGVLTCDSVAQAEARSQPVPAGWAEGAAGERKGGGGKQTFENKGIEAMHALVRTASALRELAAGARARRVRA